MSSTFANSETVSAPAAVLALMVHAVLFALLFFGIHWHSKLPEAVYVELWTRPPTLPQPAAKPAPPPRVEPKPEPKVEPKPEPKIEPKPEPKVEAKVEPPPPEPKVEPKPVKPDIAVEKEKPPKKVEPKKEEPKKPPPKKVAPKKVAPKKVEPRIQKFDRSEAILKEAERDLRHVTPSRPVQPPSGGPVADNSYVNKIKTKVRSNVVLPTGIVGNPEAIFDVVQLITGDVYSVQLRKSSGHQAYDEAVERAILKSSPLPLPDRPEQFARELQLKFRPNE